MAGNPFLSAERVRGFGLNLPPVAAARDAPMLVPGRNEYGPPAPSDSVSQYYGCEAQRVQLAGGLLNAELLHPSITPFERLYRRLPEEGMFAPGVSPSRPFAFELGAFTVPTTFCLVLFDFRPDIYRFSGIDPGDFVPVEARRFASIMGFELTVDQRHPGNLEFQIDPVPIQNTALQAFTNKSQAVAPGSVPSGVPPPLPPSVFNIAAASSFANAAGAGLSLLPQRHDRYGALNAPFTIYARGGQTVQLRCVVFRSIPSPIAFIEFDMAGFLVPNQWLEEMLRCVKPTMDKMHPDR